MTSRPFDEPIRVVHVITRLILGGAQENTLLTCEGLASDPAWKVTLITGPAEGPEGSLMDRARAGGLDVRVIPSLQRELHPLRDALALQELQALFHELHPHVVHTHSSKAGFLGRLAALWHGAPVIVHTIHGLPFHPYESGWRNALYRGCERIAAGWTDQIVSVADAMTDQAVAAGVASAASFVTLRSGMETERFETPSPEAAEVRARFRIPAEARVLACVARLFPLKGHDDLMKAMPFIRAAAPGTHLMLVGDGMLRDSIGASAARAGLSDGIHFAGLIPPERLPSYLQAADVIVHPSYREGLARVLPQALLAGRPVVSYDVDGAREVVEDGVTGRLVSVGDPRAFADAVIEVLGAGDAYRSRVEAARPRVREAYDHRRMVEALKECYRIKLERAHA